MEVVIVPDAETGGRFVAEGIARLVELKPDALLGVATGSTPLPVYRALAALTREGGADLSRVRIAQLDEYVGLPAGHPQSYRSVLEREVLEPLGLGAEAFLGPDSTAADLPAACRAYEHALAAAGGVDLQLLGIGGDGHIGFNEPCSSLASRTRIKTLTERTRGDNARFFGGDVGQVPRHVITQGVGTILEARHVVLLATGPGKAEALAAAVEGPLAARCPASALQLHPHVTVVADEAAASRLELADYFRHVLAGKPAWQALRPFGPSDAPHAPRVATG
ncbi:glucosamine-6-phosphate deaminase [Streptomyces sp. NPDC002734]|uniref:glucosamine-6-phosphate deaminase n=1 Tax=Streptomyces sp. NPDC002734 TaxID=3154426 RepID=UPI00331E2B82